MSREKKHKSFRLDRTAFRAQSFEEAERYTREFWRSKTVEERLCAAHFLIMTSYGFDPENPPRMDKTAFSYRKFEKR